MLLRAGRWFSLALLLAACGNDRGEPRPDAGPVDPPAADGAELYRVNCARCHGPDGAGTAMAPQVLSPVRPYATYVVRHGRGPEMGFPEGMEALEPGALSDAQLGAILDWLGEPAKPTTGQGLYVRFCGNCHGANAQGGRVEEDLTGEADEPDELFEKVREGHGDDRYGARTKYMPAWTRSEITDAEIDLIVAYVASLPPAPDDDDDDDEHDDD
ncbi:MAG: c-type cytochrome [Kofleriaceae bacterium]